MKSYHTTCSYCSARYGIQLTPYISQLQDEWEAIVWCACNKDAFGIRLTLIEHNDQAKYKKIRCTTTTGDDPQLFLAIEELPHCEVCNKQAELVEVGFYWVCNHQKCIDTATNWCHKDLTDHTN